MRRVMKRILLLCCGLLILAILALPVFLLGQVNQPDAEKAALEEALRTGRPVLVAFYSKNCQYCKADEPVLEQLERDFDGALTIVRISVQTEYGQQLAQQVGVRGVPTYFLIDPVSGDMLYSQAGPLQVDKLLEALP